ncbi:GNAT family N-acetyltransferase [Paracoccus contaminans]|uniref:Ribosomal-protein-alanine acetyltransferase n=1 Tax=Paracoccus contaminans TaxID=1945662 RepID=A0A1W6CVS8_9RHOB|nr:GNAT family N-acetyltransferase [Paracoccus contaminans]ARJ68935.1 ribosomal-protein-alanine acetyltransferase [Paracoccus contaminans]
MTPEALAALHAVCFRHPRPWSAREFADLAAAPGALLLTAGGGFLLGRVIADEAELLTIAVPPACRRSGVGRALVNRFLSRAGQAGAAAAFLEVASDNAAALSLYGATGWTPAGRRRDYYAPGLDAVVMRTGLCGPDGPASAGGGLGP